MKIKKVDDRSYILDFPSGVVGIFVRQLDEPLISFTDFSSIGVTLTVKDLRELLEWIDENEKETIKPIEKVDGSNAVVDGDGQFYTGRNK